MFIKPESLGKRVRGRDASGVVTQIKRSLSAKEDTSRLYLRTQDIRWVTGKDEKRIDKIDQFGEHELIIRVMGVEKAVRRTIRVRPEEKTSDAVSIK